MSKKFRPSTGEYKNPARLPHTLLKYAVPDDVMDGSTPTGKLTEHRYDSKAPEDVIENYAKCSATGIHVFFTLHLILQPLKHTVIFLAWPSYGSVYLWAQLELA